MESFSNSVLFPVTNCKHRALVNFRSKHECGTLAVGCRVKPDNENTKKKERRKKKKTLVWFLLFSLFLHSPPPFALGFRVLFHSKKPLPSLIKVNGRV